MATAKPSSPRFDERRAQIIAVARTLFIERGFHATGVAQIAATAGFAIQQLYRDFINKAGLVAAIVETDTNILFDKIERAREFAYNTPDGFEQWMLSLLITISQDYARHSKLFLEIQAEAARNENIARIVRTMDERLRAALVDALVHFAPQQSAHNLEAAADLILLSIFGLNGRLAAHPKVDIQALVGRLSGAITYPMPPQLAA